MNSSIDTSALVVGIIGGTGRQGRGLAHRLARAGQCVIVGSRDARCAAVAVAELQALPGVGPGTLAAGTNAAAAGADIVIVALPYTAQRPDVLTDLRTRLTGRIVIDCANPIAFGPEGATLLPVPAGSAVAETAFLLPGSHVAAAFQHVPASLLMEPTHHLGTDTLIVADDPTVATTVRALAHRAGLRGIVAGTLRDAAGVEELAAHLITLDGTFRRYGHHESAVGDGDHVVSSIASAARHAYACCHPLDPSRFE